MALDIVLNWFCQDNKIVHKTLKFHYFAQFLHEIVYMNQSYWRISLLSQLIHNLLHGADLKAIDQI